MSRRPTSYETNCDTYPKQCPCNASFFHESDGNNGTNTNNPVIQYSLAARKTEYLMYDTTTSSVIRVTSDTPGSTRITNRHPYPVIVSFSPTTQEFCIFTGC